MKTRNGKIANLPNDIREQLNLRLLEGETGRELAAWLNALPSVQSVLGFQCNASPISEVNLTHWRQGGYLQWFTERECFDSARALADGDCNLAETGLSAERLLNVLTVRFGELLMRWDFSPDESVSESVAFATMAKKARILQGISRSVLAIHRIQSQSPGQKSEPATSSAGSRARPVQDAKPRPATAGAIPKPQLEAQPKRAALAAENKSAIRRGERGGAGGKHGDSRANPPSLPEARVSGEVLVAEMGRPEKGLVVERKEASQSELEHTPYKADLDLSEILAAV
jgi:hypothetical protein